MKTILVPTDFSKNAENALKYAVTIALKENAKIILLNAYDILITSPGLISPEIIMEEVRMLEKNSKNQLEALRKDIVKVKKVQCDVICKHGFTAEVILETAKKVKPDLVVMGTKGASGLKALVMGSNTARVIEKINYPIIAVPELTKYKGLNMIAYASDCHNSDMIVIKKLIDIAKVFNSKISIVHITEKTDQKEKLFFTKFSNTVKGKVSYNNISFDLIHGNDVEEKLTDYVKENAIELLVMSSQPHNLIGRLFATDIIKKMSYHTNVPLMVFHYSEKLIEEAAEE